MKPGAVTSSRPASGDGDGDERGAASIELAVAVTSFLLVLFFVVGGLRITTARGDVSAAARGAARAAAASYDQPEGQRRAEAVASDILMERGVACSDREVTISADFRPGAVVTATVACTVDLADVALVGFPGTERVEASAAEPIDIIRGGGE